MSTNIERNIKYYYLFSIFAFTPFSMPIITLFWQSNGLTLNDIYLLQSIFSIIIVFLDVPTGLVADRLGKKTSLKYASLIMTLGWVGYFFSSSFFTFLLSEFLLAIGVALLSGADSALLFETLKELNREIEYKKHEGSSRAFQMYSFAVCNLIGGFLGSYSLKYAVLASAIGPFIAFILSYQLIEVNKQEKIKSIREAWSSYKELFSSALKFVFKHKLIQWNLIFFSVLIGSSFWALWLYQPYMKLSGLPVWAFGIVFAGFNFFAATISKFSHRITGSSSNGKVYALLGLLQIIPLIFMSLIITPASFLFILGQQAVRGICRPAMTNEILKYTYADKRATVLSFGSLGNRLFFALTSPIIGFFAHEEIITNIVIQIGFLLILFLLLFISYKRIPEKYFQVKDEVLANQ